MRGRNIEMFAMTENVLLLIFDFCSPNVVQ